MGIGSSGGNVPAFKDKTHCHVFCMLRSKKRANAGFLLRLIPGVPLASLAPLRADNSCPVGAADCAGLRPVQNIRAEGAKHDSPGRREASDTLGHRAKNNFAALNGRHV